MFWNNKEKKTVKELRKNQGWTVRELAMHVKVDTIEILKVDEMSLKDIKEPLKSKIKPCLTGRNLDKAPWL